MTKHKKKSKPLSEETRAKISHKCCNRGEFDISEEEIAARAAEIREEWPPERLAQKYRAVEIRVVRHQGYQDHAGEYA